MSVAKEYRTLFRQGFSRGIIDKSENNIDFTKDVTLSLLLIRSMSDMGLFDKAYLTSEGLAKGFAADQEARNAVKLYGALAGVMQSPKKERRYHARELCEQLKSSQNTRYKAIGFDCAAKLLAVEVHLQILPITALNESRDYLEQAIQFYRASGQNEEARDATLVLVYILKNGPPPHPKEARSILEEMLNDTSISDDLISQAKARGACLEIDLEEILASDHQEKAASMDAEIEEVRKLRAAAGMHLEKAPLLETVGSCFLRFNLSAGACLIKEAAEEWREKGFYRQADNAWRSLTTWYLNRAEFDEFDKIQKLLQENKGLQSDMTVLTNTLAEAFDASNQGDFVSMEISLEAENDKAVTPGQKAGVLLQKCRGLDARGRTQEALIRAQQAVELLLPAKPCKMLCEALFHRGMYESDGSQARHFYTEAAKAAEDCNMIVDAARYWMILAQSLRIPIGAQHLSPDPQAAETYFAKSASLLEKRRDRDSLVALGNLAQRRGEVARFHADLVTCADEYTRAQEYYRFTEQNADLAFILAQQGLVLFELARKNFSIDTWDQAARNFCNASERFEKQGLRAESVRMLYLEGSTLFESHLLYPNPAHRLHESLKRFERAAQALETLRPGKKEFDRLKSIANLESFAAKQEDIYDRGFRICTEFLELPNKAFEWLEQMKCRVLVDSMANVNGLVPPPTANSELVKRERELEEALEKLSPSDPTTPKRWLNISRSLDDIWALMGEEYELAVYSRLRRGQNIKWSTWKACLEEQAEIAKEYGLGFLTVHFHWPHKSDSKQPVIVIGCRAEWDKPKVVRLSTDPVRLANFARLCFEAPAEGRSSTRSVLKDLGEETWQKSFSDLIQPIADWSEPDDVIGLFPHGPLHGLPLTSLLLGDQVLAERNPVFISPSASVQHYIWTRSNNELHNHPPKAAVFGCSATSNHPSELLKAREEAEFVANILPLNSSLFLNTDVNRENMLNELPRTNIVHFVGHGVEKGDGWSSGLLLAGREMITALDFHKIRIHSDLVTLSGCRTGCSRWLPGDETVGLVPNLLQAGASSVLASAWEVKETPTKLLMQDFYQNAYGTQRLPKAVAMQQATIKVKNVFPKLADWSGFNFYGDWR